MANSSLAVLCFFIVGFVRGITVDERLNDLERIVILQAETLSQHESLIREQRDKLENVQNENSVLKNHVEVLENAIEQMHKIHDVEVDASNTPETGDDQQHQSGEDLQARAQRRQTLNARSPRKVAFYAHSLGPGACLKDGQTLVFVSEEIDVGNGYNTADGIYVVPVTGTYVFTWTTAARHDWYRSEIVINRATRGLGFADAHTFYAQATSLLVTSVTAGDRVFIRRVTGSGCNGNTWSYGHMPTFAGWLLF